MARQSARHGRAHLKTWVLVVLFLLCVSAAGLLIWQTGLLSGNASEQSSQPDSDASSLPAGTGSVLLGAPSSELPSSEPSSMISDPYEGYQLIEKSQEEIHQGDLILVNYENNFLLGEPDGLVRFVDQKTDAYSVSLARIPDKSYVVEAFNRMADAFYQKTGLTTLMVISGYRSVEYQQTLYDADLKKTGLSYSTQVAVPGQSEHHTGLAIDLAVYENGGSYYFDGAGEYGWVNENCWQYGFVVRYPSDKTELTKIIYEPWHFRYLGLVHAKAAAESGLCYEEYIEMLRGYAYDGEHLTVSLSVDREFTNLNELITGEKRADGAQNVVFESYFVPAEESGTTQIPVPENVKGYEISGNNVDGFIVTIW